LAEQKSGSAAGTNTRLLPTAVKKPRLIRPARAAMAPCVVHRCNGNVNRNRNRNRNSRCAEPA
jgi:hypothetical protein